MIVLPEVSVLISTYVKGWQYKDILHDMGNCPRSGARTCLKGAKALKYVSALHDFPAMKVMNF